MKNLKKQHFVIGHGSYPFDVGVFIGHSDAEVAKILKSKYSVSLTNAEVEDIRCEGVARTAMIGHKTVLRFRVKPTVGTVAHELFHCAEFLLYRKLGIVHDENTGEEMRLWWNNQYGVKDSKGTVNPAIITLKD